MSELVLQPKYSIEKFDEIYFKNRNKSILLYKEIRSSSILTISFFLLSIFSFLIAYFRVEYWYVFVLTFAIWLLILFPWIFNLKRWITWKKDVKSYIHSKVKLETASITCNEVSITFIEDENESIIKWGDIKSVNFDKHFIVLNGTNEFVIIKNSLETKDLENISAIIKEKVKNGL